MPLSNRMVAVASAMALGTGFTAATAAADSVADFL